MLHALRLVWSALNRLVGTPKSIQVIGGAVVHGVWYIICHNVYIRSLLYIRIIVTMISRVTAHFVNGTFAV